MPNTPSPTPRRVGTGRLALTRRPGESILIGPPERPIATVQIADIMGGRVLLRITADLQHSITRAELALLEQEPGAQAPAPPAPAVQLAAQAKAEIDRCEQAVLRASQGEPISADELRDAIRICNARIDLIETGLPMASVKVKPELRRQHRVLVAGLEILEARLAYDTNADAEGGAA